jgi:uncharacterized membrane protein YesL
MTTTTAAVPKPSVLGTLSDTLMLGAAVTVASLGVVTAGPALAAAATVVRGWESGDERPLTSTFAATVRAQTGPLLLPQAALLLIVGLVWVDIAATGAGLPGATAVRVLVAAIGGFAVASYLAMFAVHARDGGTWWSAWATAARLGVRRPGLPVTLLIVTGIASLIVTAAPPVGVVVAGPLMLAVGVLVSRSLRAVDASRP